MEWQGHLRTRLLLLPPLLPLPLPPLLLLLPLVVSLVVVAVVGLIVQVSEEKAAGQLRPTAPSSFPCPGP